ncbi:methyl-accepting chemotaxis protein [Trichlorobacter ammonificans]|uniref:Methyl-accepting chemotaxis protein (MCP) signalling domain-containing protein n=1 Tax=Trichlorobacter ammonificans TaxID=2916410 RepID=A0ABM9D5C0_9BACT|nr:methyl-accepting chemotaxis protein [Trichlorobacter ammonificans]CAH2030057.1 Methyl-accepting chemotaxis protein (MCP) signalling domain-containing protein [Trichlorobacter ammonificans]
MGLFGGSSKQELAIKDAEINKLAQMLDNVDNVVMLCDTTPDNKIFYMNRRAKELMQQHRADLNVGLRGADVANAFGNSIHQYHKDPGRIRRIFADPRGAMPHSADIPIGSVTLQTKAYPIWDPSDSSKVLCYMACWSDITAERQIKDQQYKDIERKNYLEERIHQIATAMEEMSMTVNEVAGNTTNAADAASQVAESAHQGQKVVNQAVKGMQQVAEVVRSSAAIVGNLGATSEKIGEIVNVINEIADQTNLLALNAAIEAARAGEMGRGFAVVADEVRRLAERTMASTKQIGSMVSEIQSGTQKAVASIEAGKAEAEQGEQLSHQAEDSLSAIVDSIENIKHMIAQIATASEEQAATATVIAGNLEEISRAS